MKPGRIIRTTGAAIAASVISFSAHAAIIPFNGHYYEFIQLNSAISWTDARAAALSRAFMGERGYLVNITSAAENAFVLNLTPQAWIPSNPLLNDGWIGATDKEVEGDWKWTDGPEGGMSFWLGDSTGNLVAPFVFAGWGSFAAGGDNNEPNDFKVLFPGGEDYAHLQGFFGWNDLPNIERTPRHGYFVEYGSTLTDVVEVAEPDTLSLFALGFAGLGFFGWRRRIR